MRTTIAASARGSRESRLASAAPIVEGIMAAVTMTLASDTGSITLAGRLITRRPPYAIARLGVARTFQTAQLFGDIPNGLLSLRRTAQPRADVVAQVSKLNVGIVTRKSRVTQSA